MLEAMINFRYIFDTILRDNIIQDKVYVVYVDLLSNKYTPSLSLIIQNV